MWHEICIEKDITFLMETVGYFHDSCLKELKYVSGAYVNNDLSMHPINDTRELKMIIQRQDESPSAIEFVFSGTIASCFPAMNNSPAKFWTQRCFGRTAIFSGLIAAG